MRLAKRQYECRSSSEFRLNENVFYIKDTGFLMSLKKDPLNARYFEHSLRLHLAKKTKTSFSVLNEEPVRCVFCGKVNQTHYPKYQISEDRQVTIVGTGYRNIKKYCFDQTSDCPGKRLNPNSVEFVSKTEGLSEEEALRLIHTRNKSPFYLENHKTKHDYQKTQRQYFYGREPEQVKNGIRQILETRLKNSVEHQEFSKKTAFTFISKTEGGHILCSNGERYFFEELRKQDLIKFVKTNGFYKNDHWCYDFYFEDLDLYVEIAGMCGEKYEKRLSEKGQSYNVIVIKSRSRNFKKQCSLLALQLKDKLNA